MRVHTIAGQRMLDRVGGTLHDVGIVVRSARERYAGDGYPDALAGHEIPMAARDRRGRGGVQRDDDAPPVPRRARAGGRDARAARGRAARSSTRRSSTPRCAVLGARPARAAETSWPDAS